MLEKLQAIQQRYEEAEARLSAPETYGDPALVARLNREQKELAPLVETYREYEARKRDLADAQALLSDPDMKELAQEEFQSAKADLERLEETLKILLLPSDPNDGKNVIMEIRAGVGGEEAALFAPETESGGRIHTSTVTVAVLPEVDEVEFHLDPADVEMQVFRASGAGGQHVNKTSSAVRLIHKPTGTVVECQQERSQFQNRDKAMRLLASRLYEAELEKQESAVTEQRRTQVGSGMRNERIRTYNFPQGRLTDHRIGLTLYRLDAVMNGDLDEIIDGLVTADRAERLKASEE